MTTKADQRRRLHGRAPRHRAIREWGSKKLAAERRRWIRQVLQEDVVTSLADLQERVTAYFGRTLPTYVLSNDMRQLGAIRVHHGKRYRYVITDTASGDALLRELTDRCYVDLVDVDVHDGDVIAHVTRGTAAALAELIHMAAEEGLLMKPVWVLYGDAQVVIRARNRQVAADTAGELQRYGRLMLAHEDAPPDGTPH